jgi:hypothetical protein
MSCAIIFNAEAVHLPTVVAFRPHTVSVGDADELSGDTEKPVGLANTAFQHQVDLQVLADRLNVFIHVLRDALDWPAVDAGGGWLIFGLPPAEIAVHPAEQHSHELYLMCDDVKRTVANLERKGLALARPIADAGWGRVTAVELPDGSALGRYEPRHPTALERRTSAPGDS